MNLTTGLVGLIMRSEFDAGFYPQTAVLLAAALDGSRPQIPNVEPAALLAATAYGPSLLATASSVVEAGVLKPLVTVGVAPRADTNGTSLWRRMHRVSTKLVTRADVAPIEPWCAARLEPGIFAHPEAGVWIGCLERCIAWTWVRYVEEGKWPGIH